MASNSHRYSNSLSGEVPRPHRPDMSPLSSGAPTPIDSGQAHQYRPPKPSKSKNLQHRDPSAASTGPAEGFRTPSRGVPLTFDQPSSRPQDIPAVSLNNSNESSTIAASDESDRPPVGFISTPGQPFSRHMSDRSFNHANLDASSQSGYDTPTDTASLSHVSSAGLRQAPDGIIYRLAVTDPKDGPINGTIFRYSFKPFEGLNRSDEAERQELAVMDLSSTVLGFWPHGVRRRDNQYRHNFWKEGDRAPFVLGRDFISRSHTYYSIRIHSQRVLDCLRSLIDYFPDLGLALHQPEVSFEYPYRALIHYYNDLRDMRDRCADSYADTPESSTPYNARTRNDLDVIVGHLETIYNDKISPELAFYDLDVPVAKFDTLWLLFKPGETVFARIKGQLMFFKVLSANRDINKAGDPTGPWSIVVWGLYFDGYILRRQARRFKIHEYHGQREIQKLPVKPIRYLLASDGNLEELKKRGEQYYQFICEAPLYRRYDGPVNGDGGEQYIGDVIVDPTAYIKEHANSKALPGVFEVMFGAQDQHDLGEVMAGDPPDYGGGPYSRLNDRVCSIESPLEKPEDYLLLPGYIQGYALRGKKWMAFNLRSFPPQDSGETPWKSLVINKDDMELVQSLAYSVKDHHGTELSPWTSDFIAGKGQGQVVLLHGPSGVGKTLTVECIAMQMGRPLLCLTVADIGTKETEAELNLTKWLGHATKWGAIVLIDEAETFLTRRGEGNLARNAIVAAFLRTLEYHQGMIFLTTNEPGRIDDAVMSRVHLAIQYKPLEQYQRLGIWRNLMNQLEQEQDKLPDNVPKIKMTMSLVGFIEQECGIDPKELDKLGVSGRDIRNAFQSAVRLARHEASKEARTAGGKPVPIQLKPEHISRAFKSKLDLKRNTDGVRGLSIRDRALEDGLRRD